jgi:[protein-PII] uridylyltransferase
MSIGNGLRPHVLAAKQSLAEGRQRLKQRHERGSPGIQVSRALTELFDSIVLGLFNQAVADLQASRGEDVAQMMALVRHGGYGRADIAPYSDVDLMLLYDEGALTKVAPLAERMVRDVFDVGLVLGQSVRTIAEACQLARVDAAICTSLMESNLLVGNEKLYARFAKKFKRQVQRRAGPLISAIQAARRKEREQYGETVYLLEPNVKRSPGGLRDIQFLRWVGFARWGTSDPDGLRLAGALEPDDYDHLRQTTEFLLRLRNEMHFHAGKSSDMLDRVEQLRLAERFGFRGTDGLLPVEEFMREYFRLTGGVRTIVARFVQRAKTSEHRWLRWLTPLVSHRFERDFRVGPHQISANPRALSRLTSDLAEVLRLADIANLYDKPIAPEIWEAIHLAASNYTNAISPEAAARFLALLSQPARLGELLRKLHEIGVLEKIIPQFAHARGLLQFNQYHKYTIDEHSLRAVDEATRFLSDRGPVGSVYRQLERKWLLHLALLLHDLGKGYSEDHSDVGLRIAEEAAGRLGLAERDAEILKFLVHKHLLMSHIAFRRDTSDQQLVVRFAVDVGSAEVLEMLFVMTAADLASVGPGVLNAWKVEVLAELFHRAIVHFGEDDPSLDFEARLERRRQRALEMLPESSDFAWFQKQLEALPGLYLETVPTEQVVADLTQLHALPQRGAVATSRWIAESATIEFRVATHEAEAPGVFHKLTGALSSQGLQILSAEINTLADGLIFDRFFVADPDHDQQPPADRLDTICRSLVTAVENGGHPPAFRRLWRPADQQRQDALLALPTQVRIDNSTSERYTIIDIFTADRMGLLYTIARTLFELGLSISFAKIGTYLDQVVDVFYVTDASGQKLSLEPRLRAVRVRLLEAIAEQDAAADTAANRA